jgi:hypothetical protein
MLRKMFVSDASVSVKCIRTRLRLIESRDRQAEGYAPCLLNGNLFWKQFALPCVRQEGFWVRHYRLLGP